MAKIILAGLSHPCHVNHRRAQRSKTPKNVNFAVSEYFPKFDYGPRPLSRMFDDTHKQWCLCTMTLMSDTNLCVLINK